MIDLHTHILPGVDDGAPDVQTALAMLQMEREQGADTVALTPHFYRTKEHIDEFLERRNVAWSALQNNLEEITPKLILGAEVAWVPGMADWPELEKLCYENTKVLLVELPVSPWNDEMFRQLYSLSGRRGITPMIAHLDRYMGWQKRQHIDRLLDMGFPIQISTSAILYAPRKAPLLRLLKEREMLLITDCHNTDGRAPNMGDALKVLEKKLGSMATARIVAAADEALLE